MNLKKLESLALTAADAASDLMMKQWHTHHASLKTDGSIVTNVDIAAEALIRKHLQKATPEIAIVGEESNDFSHQRDEYWIIDPIDGTRWFTLGVPVFGTLIALVRDGEPVMGVISLPVTREFLYASQGQGCYYRRNKLSPQKMQVSHAPSLETSLISASGIHGSDIWLENGSKPYALSRLFQMSKAFYFTGDCLQHLLVARGKLDAAIDTIMKPWDSAAIIPCIREAGGYVSSLEGVTENILLETSLLSACSKALALRLIEVLNA
jgi:histidinol-phosphatase